MYSCTSFVLFESSNTDSCLLWVILSKWGDLLIAVFTPSISIWGIIILAPPFGDIICVSLPLLLQFDGLVILLMFVFLNKTDFSREDADIFEEDLG